MSLRLLLTISGALEVLVGVLALISPAPVVSLLLGVPTDSLATVLARLFGAGVSALGLACLKARNDVGSPAGLAVSRRDYLLQRIGSRGPYMGCGRTGPWRYVAVVCGDRPCGARRVVRGGPGGNETITEECVGRSGVATLRVDRHRPLLADVEALGGSRGDVVAETMRA